MCAGRGLSSTRRARVAGTYNWCAYRAVTMTTMCGRIPISRWNCAYTCRTSNKMLSEVSRRNRALDLILFVLPWKVGDLSRHVRIITRVSGIWVCLTMHGGIYSSRECINCRLRPDAYLTSYAMYYANLMWTIFNFIFTWRGQILF